ncbi:MAG: hypothetical protein JW910_21085 [Anaerolineae bacterium]|nr:hypothetical protein [Anaerolineae bacterium]
MKLFRLLIIVVIVAGIAFVVPGSRPAEAASLACSNYAMMSGTYDALMFTNGMFGPFEAGETYTISATLGTATAATIRLVGDPGGVVTLAGPAAVPVTFTYTMPETGQPGGIGFYIDATNGTVEIVAGCVPAAPAGCEQYLPLTADSVVGAFVKDAQVYSEPGNAVPDLVIEAGKTYWVLGTDATGAYYKIILQCQLVWVRADTVGPNYDEVWQGEPLPTGVVE